MIAFMRFAVTVAIFSAFATAASLRAAPVAAHSNPSEAEQVVALRAKLAKVAAGLAVTLDPKGAVAKSHVAASLQSFMGELQKTLKETDTMKDSTLALKKLHDAQAGVQSLVKDMTTRQMELMKEGQDQQQSLLLGVLMTKQKEPMEKQMEVLSSPDFAKLPVVAEILRNKDTKTPLFQQAAKYMDAHRTPGPLDGPLKKDKNGKADVSGIVSALQGRIHKIEESETRRAALQRDEDAKFDEAEKKAMAKNNTKLAHRFERMKKREKRKYDKEEAITKRDHQSLLEAIEAIEHGDVKKLAKAKHALEESMKAMQSHGNGFIVFIQEAHRLEGRDCPYCVAQCIETCSSNGNSYSSCLGECADAGK